MSTYVIALLFFPQGQLFGFDGVAFFSACADLISLKMSQIIVKAAKGLIPKPPARSPISITPAAT